MELVPLIAVDQKIKLELIPLIIEGLKLKTKVFGCEIGERLITGTNGINFSNWIQGILILGINSTNCSCF